MDQPQSNGAFGTIMHMLGEIPLTVWIIIGIAILIAWFAIKYQKYLKYFGIAGALTALLLTASGGTSGLIGIIAGILGIPASVLISKITAFKGKLKAGGTESEAKLAADNVETTTQSAVTEVGTDTNALKDIEKSAETYNKKVNDMDDDDDDEFEDATDDYNGDLGYIVDHSG